MNLTKRKNRLIAIRQSPQLTESDMAFVTPPLVGYPKKRPTTPHTAPRPTTGKGFEFRMNTKTPESYFQEAGVPRGKGPTFTPEHVPNSSMFFGDFDDTPTMIGTAEGWYIHCKICGTHNMDDWNKEDVKCKDCEGIWESEQESPTSKN